MKLIVGLGNPGRTYERTRHNVGFMVVDRIAHEHNLDRWRRRFHALVAEGLVGQERFMLMKPQTFVNAAGTAVASAARWCRLDTGDILVVCDDFNLDVGRIRIRGKGSDGGHNGLASIIGALGTEAVPRLRIGIGAPTTDDPKEYVLSEFLPEESDAIREAVEKAARAVMTWITSGLAACQNQFNAEPGRTVGEPHAKEAEA